MLESWNIILYKFGKRLLILYSSLPLPFCVKSVFSKRRRKPITIFPVLGQLGFITRCLLVFFVRGCSIFTVSVSIWYLYWLSPQCSHIYILTVFDFFFVQYLILVFEAYISTPKQTKTDAIFSVKSIWNPISSSYIIFWLWTSL